MPKKITLLIEFISLATLLAVCVSTSCASPAVVPLPKSNNTVKVWNRDLKVVREFDDPASIEVIQNIFSRAKKIGDTSSHLKTHTHAIDFSDRWLIDITTGEIGVLSKAIVNVYRIEPEDLKTLQQLIPTKA